MKPVFPFVATRNSGPERGSSPQCCQLPACHLKWVTAGAGGPVPPSFHFSPDTTSHFKLISLGCTRTGSSQAGQIPPAWKQQLKGKKLGIYPQSMSNDTMGKPRSAAVMCFASLSPGLSESRGSLNPPPSRQATRVPHSLPVASLGKRHRATSQPR